MSEILNIANEMARDLFKVGAMDEITLRKIDALCLPPQRPFQPEDIRRIRTANHVSQAVFATILGLGKTTVQQWEQGKKIQAALRSGFLISLIVKDCPRLANCRGAQSRHFPVRISRRMKMMPKASQLTIRTH